jgi:hypothetical protein
MYFNIVFNEFRFHGLFISLLIGVIAQSHSAQPKLIW